MFSWRNSVQSLVIVLAEIWIGTLGLPWWVLPAAILCGALYLVATWTPAKGHELFRHAGMGITGIALVAVVAVPYFRQAPVTAELAKEIVRELPRPEASLRLDQESLDRLADSIRRAQPASAKPSGDRLVLYSQYAYEWRNYLGATNQPGNEPREIKSDVPLRKSFGDGEHLLALGIGNLNQQPILVSFILETPQDVEVLPPNGWPHGCWERTFGWTYRCEFREKIDTKTGLHANRQLPLRFPRPGDYAFEYTLKPYGIADAKVGTFRIVLD